MKKEGGGIGEGEVKKNLVWGKFVQKKYLGKKNGLGEKNGLWENLYSPFRFGEKNDSAKRGGGNDKFGKYIALYSIQCIKK